MKVNQSPHAEVHYEPKFPSEALTELVEVRGQGRLIKSKNAYE